jgi:hypothetical protein
MPNGSGQVRLRITSRAGQRKIEVHPGTISIYAG